MSYSGRREEGSSTHGSIFAICRRLHIDVRLLDEHDAGLCISGASTQ